MKRLLCALLILALLPLTALAAKSKAKTEVKLTGDTQLTLTAGKFELFTQPYTGDWESSDPGIAGAEPEANNKKKVRLVGYAEGEADLTLTGKKKSLTVHVTVKADETAENPVPDQIQFVIDIAIAEWKENGDTRLPDSTKTNKYLKWWGAKCGWCGVFTSYCMEQAGVPMDKEGAENKVKPLGSGDPHSIRVGGVGRFHDAFTNMERTTKFPRPGYLIIYGTAPKKGSSYNYEHIALVTDVKDLGDGVFQVSTVEGNWGKMVTRFCFLYDARNTTHENISPVPEADRTEPETFHNYTTHRYNEKSAKERPYFVYEFCQTWY